MDTVDGALKGCSGLIESSPREMKQMVPLMRVLRDRLSDTQINLRPTAARLLGALLSVVDTGAQAKLGKLVYAALLASAMNDIKKPTRDAALAAVRVGITASALDGGGLNELCLEALVTGLVSEVNDTSLRVRCLRPSLLLSASSLTPSRSGWRSR